MALRGFNGGRATVMCGCFIHYVWVKLSKYRAWSGCQCVAGTVWVNARRSQHWTRGGPITRFSPGRTVIVEWWWTWKRSRRVVHWQCWSDPVGSTNKTNGKNLTKSSTVLGALCVGNGLPGWESGRTLWVCGSPSTYWVILRAPRFNMHGTQGKGEVLFPAVLRRSARCCLSPARDKRPAKRRQQSISKAHHHLLKNTHTHGLF